MGFMFCDLHVSLNNPSSGDINSSNLPCYIKFTRLSFDNGASSEPRVSTSILKALPGKRHSPNILSCL